jgi:hypothetical protein
MTDTIQGFFNARQDGDSNARTMFAGIDGDTSETIITDLPEFLAAANRNYGILRVPALVTDPFGGVDEDGEIVPAVREVDGQYHLTRTNDGQVVSPHTVTGQYAPMTLLDVAAEIKPWLDAGWCTPDAVYAGKGGSLEVLSLRLDASGMLPNGETWDHHIVFRLPHGAGGKVKGTIVSFRTACANTFAGIGRGFEFVITHRISAKMSQDERQAVMAERAQKAVAAWKKAHEYIDTLAGRIGEWTAKPVSFAQAEVLTDSLLGIDKLEDASTRAKNVREAILAGFSMPKFGTHGANLYDWVNGVTFVNSSPNAEIVAKSKVGAVDRMIRNVDPNGSGNKLESKALKIAAGFLAS